jgi:hypothetical protein
MAAFLNRCDVSLRMHMRFYTFGNSLQSVVIAVKSLSALSCHLLVVSETLI